MIPIFYNYNTIGVNVVGKGLQDLKLRLIRKKLKCVAQKKYIHEIKCK